MRARLGRWSWQQWLVAAVSAGALALSAVPAALRLPVAVGHGQVHALLAFVVLAPAAVIAWNSRAPSIRSTAPIVGLVLLALAELVEGVGGLGFGPANDVRVNGLAAVHDLGLELTPLGIVGAIIGVTIGFGALLGRRFGRPVVGMIGGFAILLIGGFLGAKLIGM